MDVVTNLIREAMAVAEGAVPQDLFARVEAAIARAERIGGIAPEALLDRLTPLDPQRPAADVSTRSPIASVTSSLNSTTSDATAASGTR